MLDAARRELLEETGYAAAELEVIAEGVPSGGLTSETITFVRATGLERRGPGGGDETESIETHVLPLAEVEAWLRERVAAGRGVDAKLWSGLWFARDVSGH